MDTTQYFETLLEFPQTPDRNRQVAEIGPGSTGSAPVVYNPDAGARDADVRTEGV